MFASYEERRSDSRPGTTANSFGKPCRSKDEANASDGSTTNLTSLEVASGKQRKRQTRTSAATLGNSRLLSEDDWRGDLRKHFLAIFHKRDVSDVDEKFQVILRDLSRRCKHAPWIPFDSAELKAVRAKWKNNKACGPDRISYEALKILESTDYWRAKILYLMNDLLYVGDIPAAIERGITVLLAKNTKPNSWGDTRPITLSSVLLRTFSQLIINRVSHHVQEPSRLQWSRRHRQGAELVWVLRKVCRTSHDWGIPMYLAKLDIRKAFDSVYQEALAGEIARDVGEAGDQPWEAKAWVSLLKANRIRIFFRGDTFEITQSNGVRQGSPDSPIAFGRIVARTLDLSLQEAQAERPTQGEPPPVHGESYMDDTYIWSTSRAHMQSMLCRLCTNLRPKGLEVHPDKTEIIANDNEGATFEIDGQKVACKGPDHVVRTLGSPLCFRGTPATLVAEMQARSRRAFNKHRGTLMSEARVKDRLQMHTILVRQSALWCCETWPCLEFILKSANSVQLLQARTMLKQPRPVGELWADWHTRSMRGTRSMLHRCKIERWSTYILRMIWGLAGHACRGDPVAADMMRWRNLRWWRVEQTIPRSWGGHRHGGRFNPHLDIERQIAAIAGEAWQEQTADRQAAMEEQFVARFDVPWSSGNQAQIENLMPNQAQDPTTTNKTMRRPRLRP